MALPRVAESGGAGGLEAALPRERGRLVRLCARLTGDVDAAEDLAQETLLEAWRHAHKLRNPDGLAPWLSAVARNVCLRWARARGRELARLAPVGREGVGSSDAGPADGFDLEVALERDELAELLDRALALLPAETRATLVARYIHDAPQAEVAARLGLSEGAVAMRLRRGKLALRRVLATDLHREAAPYGLDAPQSAGWMGTRIWCCHCGQRRLAARFDATSGEFILRCRECDAIPDSDVTYWVVPGLLDGRKGYRASFDGLMAIGDAYYGGAIEEGAAPCALCGRPLALRTTAPAMAPPSVHRWRALHLRCPDCPTICYTTLAHRALYLPEGRRFWRAHQRIRILPEREIAVAGRAAIVSGFESVTGVARFEVVADRETYALIALGGAPEA